MPKLNSNINTSNSKLMLPVIMSSSVTTSKQALMRQTRLLADNAYADEISQINLRLMQEQEASAQQKQKAAREGLQARGAVVAGGRIGNTIDALVADYQRQQAQFDYATERNLAFTTMQMQEAKRGSAATRGSRIASQQEYIKQEILDPLKPMKQAAPSATPFILQGAGAALQGGWRCRVCYLQAQVSQHS
jgi:hypothetical protein